jgi:RNA polymerase sigma-70 factor (ECF subfamily)
MSSHDNPWAELTPPLQRFIRRHVRDAQSVEDVFQEVILRLESHRDRMPPAERRLPWALRVARNLIVDQQRAARLRQHLPLDNDVAAIMPPADPVSKKELARCVSGMVDRLPEPYRRSLRLADLQGMDQRAIAVAMNLSPSGARSRVQRARQQLRGMILDYCDIEQNARGEIVDYQPKPHRRAACAGPEAGSGSNSCVIS